MMMGRSGRLPGWPVLLLDAVLIYAPAMVVDAAAWLVDRVRDVDDALADLGGED